MGAAGAVGAVGRFKDRVRRSGDNVACNEVEQLFDQHPAVVMSAVVGVPDEVLGEEVQAYIQLARHSIPPEAVAVSRDIVWVGTGDRFA